MYPRRTRQIHQLPVQTGSGFSQAGQFGSASVSNAGLLSMQAWAGTFTASSAASGLLTGCLPSIVAATPAVTANAASSGARVATNTIFLDSSVAASGKPYIENVWAVDVAFNANNRFFAGMTSTIAFTNSPLNGAGLGIRFGVGMDAGSSRLFIVGYDGSVFFTPVDTGVDLTTGVVYKAIVSFSRGPVFRCRLLTTTDFVRWVQVASAAWSPPTAIATAADVATGFGNAAAAGPGVLRIFSTFVKRA